MGYSVGSALEGKLTEVLPPQQGLGLPGGDGGGICWSGECAEVLRGVAGLAGFYLNACCCTSLSCLLSSEVCDVLN